MPAPSKAAPKRQTGSKLGKYTLDELLGSGGYGEVYVGKPATGRNVAIKVLDAVHARDEDAVERFKREAETAQRLEHPNIVRVIDVGSSRGRHYLVMELVAGGSFYKLLRKDDPDPAQLLAALTDAASALAHAHAQGVVHRDVKPANILLTRAGRAKVADFGLARAMDHSSLTTEGRLLGTATYMSPEQAKGDRATTASDVYAVGLMIYEAITGRHPFEADNQLGYLYQHAEVEPPRPAVRAPFPASLGALAIACLAKDPRSRPTMAAVAERLAAASLVRRRRYVRPLAVAAVMILALALLIIAVPRVLDPLAGSWFGGGVFRALQRGALDVRGALL